MLLPNGGEGAAIWGGWRLLCYCFVYDHLCQTINRYNVKYIYMCVSVCVHIYIYIYILIVSPYPGKWGNYQGKIREKSGNLFHQIE